MKRNLIITILIFGIISCKKDNNNNNGNNNQTENVSDIDGNSYKTIKIGNKIWMAENLRVKRFRNGDSILRIVSDNDWKNNTLAAYCTYDNLTPNNSDGLLYNWYAVDDNRNIAPIGWHIPTKTEWLELINSLGGDSIAGCKMKSTTGWDLPNNCASNSSGFSSIGVGERYYLGMFISKGQLAHWWSSTEYNGSFDAWSFANSYLYGQADNWLEEKRAGLSIRCVKD